MLLRSLVASGAVLLLAGAAAGNTSDTLRGVAATYYANARQIATLTGRDTAMDYYQRLLDDADQGLTGAAVALDLSLATQLLHRSFTPMAEIRGLGETFARSSMDGTMQPVAIYVPRDYSPARPVPLVVFLHGRLQAESHLIAPDFIEDLAERTNTIVVAPYGRGYYDFRGSESDVYDALDAAVKAFDVDPHRRYLAGYSMGGFSLFRIAPMHPADWSAVMSIAGSLLASRAAGVVGTLQHARCYVLTGARDSIVPTAYPTATAIFLRDAGLAVTFYSDPDGTHSLYSLRSILSSAWTDMERGVVRLPVGLSGAADLPSAAGN
ncbi:MAG TPA: alpha/beta hydrolase-fold protein [Candidatus Cybelea sp.]